MRFFRTTKILAAYSGNFFARYNFYLVAFIFSTFIASYVGITNSGLVAGGASAAAFVALAIMPTIFRRVGTAVVLAGLGAVQVFVLILLAVARAPVVIIVLSILMSCIAYSLFLGLDILLEAMTADEGETGGVRGTFLTITNLSALIATLTLSVILTDDNYYLVFLSAAALLVPFIVIAATGLPRISSVAPAGRTPASETIRAFFATPYSLKPIMGVHLLLQLYYSWSIFYIPLYLHLNAGLSWHVVAIIMAVSIIPYLIIELPLGWIADKFIGEREILIVGTILLGIGTLALAWPASEMLQTAMLLVIPSKPQIYTRITVVGNSLRIPTRTPTPIFVNILLKF